MFEPTALDAFIAGLSTAFFGALVAGGAYLLQQQLSLREQVATLRASVSRVQALERFVTHTRPWESETLKTSPANMEGDADEP